MLMVRDVMLAFGLLLSTASQLRLAGAVVGPGEVCIVIWLVLMLNREMFRFGPALTPALSRLLMFWTFFAIAQAIGTLTGFAIGDVHDRGLFLHDVMIYLLLAIVSCLSVVEPGAGARLRRVARLLVTLGSISLGLQLANAWDVFAMPQMDPWYWDRLRGWSENPNQLALFCLVIGLLALHLADATARFGERSAAIACAALAIYVGRLTKSDTFNLVLLAAGPIFIALKLRSWVLSPGWTLTFRSASAWIVVLALPIFIISVTPAGYAIAVKADDVAKMVSKDSGQSSVDEALLRLTSWKGAVDRGIESGMLGLGPGPHLEIPAVIVAARKSTKGEPKYVEHPALDSGPNFEAHNTLLDLFTQGGVIAVAGLVWLVSTALAITFRARLDGLTTLLCGLAAFSISHFILRHPLFWFAIAFCLVAGAEEPRASAVRN
jgi:hypothetical protein